MKKLLLTITLFAGFLCFASAKVVTLTIDATTRTNSVTVGANEIAEIKTYFDSSSTDGTAIIQVTKDGRSFSVTGSRFLSQSTLAKTDGVTIAGPATVAFLCPTQPAPSATAFLTVKVSPESFPPGLTIILPEGTVGIVHVESSTNLIQWQDEWVNTFSNTNQNRFFRIRAERSIP